MGTYRIGSNHVVNAHSRLLLTECLNVTETEMYGVDIAEKAKVG